MILGPFTSRGILDTQEKFRKVLESGTAAREAGEGLAWDSKTGRGRGRFMLAPAFFRPRDAWDFYRGGKIAEAIERAAAGYTIRDVIPADHLVREIVPACVCGLHTKPLCRFCGSGYQLVCPLHEPDAAVHSCRRAA